MQNPDEIIEVVPFVEPPEYRIQFLFLRRDEKRTLVAIVKVHPKEPHEMTIIEASFRLSEALAVWKITEEKRRHLYGP